MLFNSQNQNLWVSYLHASGSPRDGGLRPLARDATRRSLPSSSAVEPVADGGVEVGLNGGRRRRSPSASLAGRRPWVTMVPGTWGCSIVHMKTQLSVIQGAHSVAQASTPPTVCQRREKMGQETVSRRHSDTFNLQRWTREIKCRSGVIVMTNTLRSDEKIYSTLVSSLT